MGQTNNQDKTSSRGITLSKSILPAATNLAIARARVQVVKASLPTSNSMALVKVNNSKTWVSKLEEIIL
jgi:hypothetical protein